MTYRTSSILSLCILILAVSVYIAALFVVYTMRHTRVVPTAPDVSKERQIRIKRVQSKIEELFLVQDDASKIFDMFDVVAKKHSVIVGVESVTNPQVASRGKLVPVSFVDAKIVLTGSAEDTFAALEELEFLPTLTRVTDVEIAEAIDAEQPKVTAAIRFYVRNI